MPQCPQWVASGYSPLEDYWPFSASNRSNVRLAFISHLQQDIAGAVIANAFGKGAASCHSGPHVGDGLAVHAHRIPGWLPLCDAVRGGRIAVEEDRTIPAFGQSELRNVRNGSFADVQPDDC
jgi:hypothetical protein